MQPREVIDFYSYDAGIKSRLTGIKVGKHLVVGYLSKHTTNKVRIYGILSGRPVTELKFPATQSGVDQAIQMAKGLDTIYHDYFDLWLANPEWSIIDITRWTVKDGIRLWIYFSRLEELQSLRERMALSDDTISVDDMHRAWDAALLEVPSYTRFINPR